MRLFLSFLILAASLAAQTTINGSRTILGAWDASGATATKAVKSGTSLPSTCAVGEFYFKTDASLSRKLYTCEVTNEWFQVAYSQGTSLPATCTVGDIFFDTDATAGSNLYGCTASNTWTAQGGSGSGGITSLIDPQYVVIREEFNNVNYGGAAAWTGIGSTWRGLVSGTGATSVQRSSTWPNLAQLGIKSGSTASGNQMYLGLATSINIGSLYENSDKAWTMYWTFGLEQTTNTVFIAGHGQNISSIGRPQDWFGIRYDSAASANFGFCFAGNNTDFVCYDSGVAADTSFHTVKIRADGTTASKVWFRLDGGTERSACASGCDITPPASFTANYATVPFALIETLEAAAKQVNLDYFGLEARVSANADRRN